MTAVIRVLDGRHLFVGEEHRLAPLRRALAAGAAARSEMRPETGRRPGPWPWPWGDLIDAARV